MIVYDLLVTPHLHDEAGSMSWLVQLTYITARCLLDRVNGVSHITYVGVVNNSATADLVNLLTLALRSRCDRALECVASEATISLSLCLAYTSCLFCQRCLASRYHHHYHCRRRRRCRKHH